jgi:hypothetical protein
VQLECQRLLRYYSYNNEKKQKIIYEALNSNFMALIKLKF